MDYAKESLKKHAKWGGKIEVISKVPCKTKEDLSLAYTPGVAQPCLEIQKDINKSYELTRRHNLCAVITDGTVLTAKTSTDGIEYDGGKDYWGFQHVRQIADFYAAVEQGRDPALSAREALKIQKIICAIYESGKNDTVINLND